MERWVDALGLVAGVTGAALAFTMWRRARRHHARARRRHPATTTPIAFAVDRTPEGPRWAVRLSGGWPTTAIDIVTWRRSGTDDPWTSEPIVDPVILEPGTTARLGTLLPDPDATYDVVVGWTTRHRTGEVTGARTLTVPERADDGPTGPSAGAAAFRVVDPLVGVLLLAVALVALVSLVEPSDDATADAPVDGVVTTPGTTPGTTTTITTTPTTSTTTATTTTTTTAATTSTTTTAATTSTTTTTTSGTTTPGSSTSTTPGTTTGTTSGTTTPGTTPGTTTGTTGSPDERRVDIRGRVEDCRFGADCLIASFETVGVAPGGAYVCEFEDGSRFTFTYTGTGAADACAASGPDPSITIEIDGLRSATITRSSPEGV